MDAQLPKSPPVGLVLQPPASLVMGESGCGKTSSLATYLEAGIETFVICTEPGGPESLVDWCNKVDTKIGKKKYDLDLLHWTTALPSTQGFKGLEEMIMEISTKNFEQISSNKNGIGKPETRAAAMNVLGAMQNFHCERTDKFYGSYTDFSDEQAFCMDSLSGVSVIGWALTVGHKPTAHMGEWNIAMNFIQDLLMKITSDRKCFFTLTAHIEKEMNELTGVNQVMVSTLGKKLAPKIPRFFSEVIYAKRAPGKEGKFTWSNVDATVALKNRGLPINDAMIPSFVPLVEAFRARKKALGVTPQPQSTIPAAIPATTVAKN